MACESSAADANNHAARSQRPSDHSFGSADILTRGYEPTALGSDYLIFTVTGLAVLPSTVTSISTSPRPARLRGMRTLI